MDRGMILNVQFQTGRNRGDWNTELRDPRTDRPIHQLPERALNDATFALNELRDAMPMDDLREYAAIRARLIEAHFMKCAHMLIKEIERAEGWPHAQDTKEPTDG